MNHSAKFLRTALVTAALSTLCVVGASAASLGVGTVAVDALRMRSGPDTASTILATASRDETVVILEEAADNWYKVDYKSVEGYMAGQYLNIAENADAAIGYGLVDTSSTLNVRSGPGTNFDRVGKLRSGAVVDIIGIDSGWYKIRTGDLTGYVSSDYMVTCRDSYGSRGDDPAVTSSGTLGQQVVELAKQFIGTPYVWGGNGPNCFDCSGFTKYIYGQFGYTLNRTASQQLKNGVPVPLDQVQPGDLVFFDNGRVSTPVSHVGIYAGNNQFIHANTNNYQVSLDDFTARHVVQKYVYARRIF